MSQLKGELGLHIADSGMIVLCEGKTGVTGVEGHNVMIF